MSFQRVQKTCSLKLNYDEAAGGDLVLGGEHEGWMMWFLRHNLEILRASPFFHSWPRFSLKTHLPIAKKKKVSFFLSYEVLDIFNFEHHECE